MTKSASSFIVSFFLLCSTCLVGVENSILPIVNQFETFESLPAEKFSKHQFFEIQKSLSHLDEKIRIVSYNVLFNLYDHNLEEVNRWHERLPRIVALLDEMQPDIIGVQELYPSQYKDLEPYLENTYAFVSQECEDGEHNGIFYRKDRFEMVERHVWLISSSSLTMLQLKDVKTGKRVGVYNTHLDFSNVDIRDFQARFIAEQMESKADELPVMLTGDLNTFPHRMDLEKLPFYDGDYVHQILTRGALKDAKEVSALGHVGPIATFTNAGGDDGRAFKGTGTPGVFLDHIYVSNKIKVLIHAVQPGTVGGHFPSDHLPVFIDFFIE